MGRTALRWSERSRTFVSVRPWGPGSGSRRGSRIDRRRLPSQLVDAAGNRSPGGCRAHRRELHGYRSSHVPNLTKLLEQRCCGLVASRATCARESMSASDLLLIADELRSEWPLVLLDRRREALAIPGPAIVALLQGEAILREVGWSRAR